MMHFESVAVDGNLWSGLLSSDTLQNIFDVDILKSFTSSFTFGCTPNFE
ncbi:MAG: hypothetical protein AAF990_08615 [Bacteroidota bacterium]